MLMCCFCGLGTEFFVPVPTSGMEITMAEFKVSARRHNPHTICSERSRRGFTFTSDHSAVVRPFGGWVDPTRCSWSAPSATRSAPRTPFGPLNIGIALDRIPVKAASIWTFKSRPLRWQV